MWREVVYLGTTGFAMCLRLTNWPCLQLGPAGMELSSNITEWMLAMTVVMTVIYLSILVEGLTKLVHDAGWIRNAVCPESCSVVTGKDFCMSLFRRTVSFRLSALENYAFFGGLSNVCTQML
jgi:hypothetical protein